MINRGSYEEVLQNLDFMRKSINSLAEEMQENLERNDLNLVLHNLLVATANEIIGLLSFSDKRSSLIAWCSRNLYELNLVVRYVLQSEKNLRNWMAQAASDEIEIWEGYLELADDKTRPEESVIREHINSIKNTVAKYDLKLTKFLPAHKLAETVGLHSEHKSFYKFYSKYVHPSSLLINKPEKLNLLVFMNTLLINAQIYAADTYERVSRSTELRI
jgi:hypothetical protein